MSETDPGRDVLAFHLHRYLAHWLAKSGTERVFVTVGWEHAAIKDVTVEVGRRNSHDVAVSWTFERLASTHHQTGAQISVETDEGRLAATPILESSTNGTPLLLAFALTDAPLSSELRTELEIHAAEAIRAARRNGVRLFFDECDEDDNKALLYALLDRLPEWVGTDIAAAVVLANSLEAMSFERANAADFYVMAERLFLADHADATRLVGLGIDTRDDVRTVVDTAIERLGEPDGRAPIRFVREGDHYRDDRGDAAVSIGALTDRPPDAQSIVAPIVADRHDDAELIGFLCLAFSRDREVPASVDELLRQLGEELGHTLRTSPLYTLSASRLRLVREVRSACERHVGRDGDPSERRDALVAEVADLVRGATAVPAFSVGYIVGTPRQLRYTASYGWSSFEQIDLLVDVADDAHADSGVSALAVRLNRPIVLAGGRREGEHQEFKNFLWVHEGSGHIVDARAPGVEVEGQAGWTRLGEYYKPARAGAYATIAHPIAFDGRALGVVALEVDRDTPWTWWAGYGSRLFWELICSELAFALWALNG